jgi:hypothetical protein
MRETYLRIAAIPQKYGKPSLLCELGQIPVEKPPPLETSLTQKPASKGFPLSQEFNKGKQKFSL